MEPSNFSGAPSIDVLQAAMPLAQDHAIVIATSSASAWLKGKSDSGNHGFPMKLSLKPISESGFMDVYGTYKHTYLNMITVKRHQLPEPGRIIIVIMIMMTSRMPPPTPPQPKW